MKLGFITAILDNKSYEEVIDCAHELGYQCVEVACWPAGAAERRYAGISHIDCERVLRDDAYAEHILQYARERGVEISATSYYPNPLDPDPERRQAIVGHLKTVVRASHRLGVDMVGTFIGRDQSKTVEENLALAGEVWPEIIALAENLGVKIAIENCPMLFGPDQWPGGQNIMTSPENWRRVFQLLPSQNLGLNFDPSHFVWQMMDYIKPIYEFKDKLFHIHFKDIKLYPDKLSEVGVMAYPLEFMQPKLPGLGDIRWDRFVSALTDVGYDGAACIEVEDRSFEGDSGKVRDSLILSRRYMEQFVI